MTSTAQSQPAEILPRAVESALPRRRGFGDFLRRYAHNRRGMIGVGLVLFFLIVALGADLVAPYDPAKTAQFRSAILQGPTAQHWLGTDYLGRDLLSRVIHGSRISLQVMVIAVSIAVVLGVFLGILAGYFGGWVDNLLIMRVMDAMMSFPTLILLMAIAAAVGSSLNNTMIIIGIVFSPGYARLSRAVILSLKEEAFFEAAVVLGAKPWRIMFRHLLPNVIAPVVILASLSSAGVILTEAALSFIGLGVKPPTPAWGSMLYEGYMYILSSPWPSLGPGFAIILLVLGFNFFGDGLRDTLDPRLRGKI